MVEQLSAPREGSLDLGFLDELFGSEAQPMDQLPGMRDEVGVHSTCREPLCFSSCT